MSTTRGKRCSVAKQEIHCVICDEASDTIEAIPCNETNQHIVDNILRSTGVKVKLIGGFLRAVCSSCKSKFVTEPDRTALPFIKSEDDSDTMLYSVVKEETIIQDSSDSNCSTSMSIGGTNSKYMDNSGAERFEPADKRARYDSLDSSQSHEQESSQKQCYACGSTKGVLDTIAWEESEVSQKANVKLAPTSGSEVRIPVCETCRGSKTNPTDSDKPSNDDGLMSVIVIKEEPIDEYEAKEILHPKPVDIPVDIQCVFMCDVCGVAFHSACNLKRHQESAHPANAPGEKVPKYKKNIVYNPEVASRQLEGIIVKPFRCDVCHSEYKSSAILRKHLKLHMEARPNQQKVPVSKKNRIIDTELAKKLLQEVTEPPFHCTICTKDLSSLVFFRSHVERHMAEHKCDMCVLSFADKQSLELHQWIAHLFPAQGSSSTTSSAAEIALEQLKGKLEPPYQCNACHRVTMQRKFLREHLLSHIARERSIKCDKCQEVFDSPDECSVHQEQCKILRWGTSELTIDPEAARQQLAGKIRKPYRCNICAKLVTNSWALRSHLRLHLGPNYSESYISISQNEGNVILNPELASQQLASDCFLKPFRCKVCSQTFPTANSLKDHLRIHLGQDVVFTVRCKQCPRLFRHKDDLTKHITEVHSILSEPEMSNHFKNCSIALEQLKGRLLPPFQCNVCNTVFQGAPALKHHLRLHTLPPKAFKCDKCLWSFEFSHLLNRHRRKVHKAELASTYQKIVLNTDVALRQLNSYIESPYRCDVCSKEFPKIKHLKNHLKRHLGPEYYQPRTVLRNIIINPEVAARQLRRKLRSPFNCEVCLQTCASGTSLRRHLRRHLGPGYEEASRNMTDLEIAKEQLTKTDEGPYPCNVCQVVCATESTIKGHLMQHLGPDCIEHAKLPQPKVKSTEEIAWQQLQENSEISSCRVCQRAFVERRTLRKHLQRYLGPNFVGEPQKIVINPREALRQLAGTLGPSYRCNVCYLGCSSETELKQHLVQHLGSEYLEPLAASPMLEPNSEMALKQLEELMNRTSCNVCYKPFHSRKYLKIHLKHHIEPKASDESVTVKSEEESS